MKKKVLIYIMVSAVLTGIAMYSQNASAVELKAVTLKSHGNIIYKSEAGTVMFFEEDLALLRRKIFSLSEEQGGE